MSGECCWTWMPFPMSCSCFLRKILRNRDTQSCTGAIHRNPISLDRTTFSPAPQPKRRGLKQSRLFPAASPLKARAPGGKGSRRRGEKEQLPRTIRGVDRNSAFGPTGSSVHLLVLPTPSAKKYPTTIY
ncbi:uncharacterized protein LOC112896793 [Panicum hallii]|uniref:uncharacterized protein LOC112896793 n=1 Tax=Panicum hallii TaxID=206008 RepID=UPI000DF4E1E4|nr:uncharacterized protein LOC112896793 [Panicum hallii]